MLRNFCKCYILCYSGISFYMAFMAFYQAFPFINGKTTGIKYWFNNYNMTGLMTGKIGLNTIIWQKLSHNVDKYPFNETGWHEVQIILAALGF